MISFADIQDRIIDARSDKIGRESQLAFQIAARRLAVETLGLFEVVTFTAVAGSKSDVVYDPDTVTDKVSIHIFKAEAMISSGLWAALTLLNQRDESEFTREAVPQSGTLHSFTTSQGLFVPHNPPLVDTQVRAVVAYKPVGDFDEVNFGPGYEDALVEGALSHLFRLAGPEKSMRDAEDSERKFQCMSGTLRALELIGDAGNTSAQPCRSHFNRGEW